MFIDLEKKSSVFSSYIKNDREIVWYSNGFFLDPLIVKNTVSQYWYEQDSDSFNFLKVLESSHYFENFYNLCLNTDLDRSVIDYYSFLSALPFEYFLLSVPRAFSFLLMNSEFPDNDIENVWRRLIAELRPIHDIVKYKTIRRDLFSNISSRFKEKSCLFLINLKNYPNNSKKAEYNLRDVLENLEKNKQKAVIKLDRLPNFQINSNWKLEKTESDILIINYENN